MIGGILKNMEYRNSMNPGRAPCDGEELHRVLADTASACGCTRQTPSVERRGDGGANGTQSASPMTRGRTDYGGANCPNEQKNVAPLRGFPLAMVYSPEQEWQDLYEPEDALAHGTLFTALDYPWYPAACNRGCGKEAVR